VPVSAAVAASEPETPSRAWLVWTVGAFAYVVAVFHRASLGVSAVEAQERFGATAAALSLFVVLQIAVYASLQVPVGALLDRVGPRRMIAGGAAVMAGGQILLATSHAIGLAVAARALIGAGDAMTFISVLRLVSLWFAPRRIPVMSQLTGLLGQFGQIAAAYPLVALLRAAGWTTSFALAAGVGAAVAVLVIAVVRDRPAGEDAVVPPALAEVRAHVGHAWREPGTRLGLWTHFVTQFPATVFALLWGYPFLVVGEGRTPQEAGLLLTVLVVVGMAVGPVLGAVAGRWPYRRSVPTLAIVGATAAAWTLVLLWPGRAPFALLVLLVLVMATNGPGSLVGFDYARTENHPARIGSATGIVNVGGFIASLTAILLIGLVLDRLNPGGDRSSYTLGDFRIALSVQYLLWAVGLAGVLRSRRRLRAQRGISIDTFPRAVVRVRRERSRARREDG
jgi:sugar phosphate permease